MENAATDVSKAEELDVAERGQGLTKAELAEFALMRTHALWKHFVQDVSRLQLDNKCSDGTGLHRAAAAVGAPDSSTLLPLLGEHQGGLPMGLSGQLQASQAIGVRHASTVPGA